MEKLMMHLVRTAKKAQKMDEGLRQLGYSDTPYWYIYGEIADAIYELLEEKTETFDESVTCAVLNANTLTEEQKVLIFMSAYRKREKEPAHN